VSEENRLVAFLVYFSALKIVLFRASEKLGTSAGLLDVTSQKIMFFIAIAARILDLTFMGYLATETGGVAGE
jgi:hypothetical protein